MTFIDLKKHIEERTIDNTFLVLKWKDNSFLSHQYVNEIANIKHRNIEYIENVDEHINNTSFIFGDIDDNHLYVCIIDKFNSLFVDFSKYDNIIVICKDIDNSLNTTNISNYVVEMPETVEWQILDYMKMKCGGIDEKYLKWLYTITRGDIYRIENEIEKISIFSTPLQQSIFEQISNQNGYEDLCDYTIFQLTNSIMTNDRNKLCDILCDIENMDVDAMGLMSILYKNIQNIIDIQTNPRATPESLSMSSKQFNAIKYSCGYYSEEKLRKMFKFILSIDSDIKNGKLQMESNRLVDYIICGCMS